MGRKKDLSRFDFDKVLFTKGYFKMSSGGDNDLPVVIESQKYRDMRDMLLQTLTTKIIEPEQVYAYLDGMGDV